MKNFLAWSCLAFVLISTVASSQVATGTHRFGSFGGGPFDTVNLGNLNVHFAIPVLHKAGRGMPFTYDLSYDSSIWTPVKSNNITQWQPVANWGWRGATEVATGYVSSDFQDGSYGNCATSTFSNYAYHDQFSVRHPFIGGWTLYIGKGCPLFHPLTFSGADGYTLNITSGNNTGTVTTRSGRVLTPPFNATTGQGTATDANGNKITVNSSFQFFDTLSSATPVLTVGGSGTPSSPTTFTYTPPSGTNVAYAMHYTQYTVATAFGVTGIGEYGRMSIPLVSSITLPDQSSYSFTYESTPGSCTPLSGTTSCVTGRIQQITLPTGGTITYAYSGGTNNTGIYSDGSTAGLTRTLNPGGAWQYSRSLVSGPPGPGST